MLMSISGISEKKAIAIVKQYPTVRALMKAYEETTLDKRPYLLENIISGKNKLG